MIGYTLHGIRFEVRNVSDWCMTGYRQFIIRFELRCVCQIGVMTGYRLYGIRFELLCVCDWCDN